MDEYDALKTLNEVVSKYDRENAELKNVVHQLKTSLKKEQIKTKEIIPQYREAVTRLKNNTQLLREKLKEIQEQRKIEKNELLQKVFLKNPSANLLDKNTRRKQENFQHRKLSVEDRNQQT